MFRLMKLAVMALLGYAIYEFFRGLLGYEMGQQSGQGGGQRSSGGEEQAHRGAGNMQFSGPGGGQRVETEEASGTTTPHYVGRGVVQR